MQNVWRLIRIEKRYSSYGE